MNILLKEDLLKCDQYSEQAKLLSKYHVNTDEDLTSLIEELGSRISKLGCERDELRLVAKRALPEAEINKARDNVKELTAEIRQLRHDLKTCSEIRERSGHVRENLEIVDRDRQREKER